jgi:hypothetical protein
VNLFEINEAVETAFNLAIDQETGEVNEDQLVLLEMLEMERDKKIENIACLIKNYRADAAALKAEKDSFAKRQKQAENRAESLSRYLESALNGEKFTSDRCAISFRRTSKIVLDEGKTVYDIDTHFLRMAEPTLDKVAIKKALDDGCTVEGVHTENGLSMTVK